MTELCDLRAREAVALLRAGDVRPADLIQAALRRIDETDAALNAMPTLCP